MKNSKKKDIKIVEEIDPEVPKIVNTDEIKLKQILVNLISNAVKFTMKGRITLSVGIEDNKIIFSIADTGIGLKDGQLNKVNEDLKKGVNFNKA